MRRLGSFTQLRPTAVARVALLAGALAACHDETPPHWIELARDFEPPSLLAVSMDWQRAAGMDLATCRDYREYFVGVQLVQPLPRASWSPGSEPGLWTTAAPRGAFEQAIQLHRLVGEGFNVTETAEGTPLAEGGFRRNGKRLELRLAPGSEPPHDLILQQYLDNGRSASDGVWHVRIGSEEYYSGIPVWSGQWIQVERDLPQASRLSFEARFLSRSAPAPVTLRVHVDGKVVFESIEDSRALAGESRWHSFALPPDARLGARLIFEVQGPPGQMLLLRPVIGPAELGTREERPWSDARPDIVLFLADTFRADGLASNGGAPELAPELNRFAEGAVRFREARSNAAWTLPSISTLLTGLAPGQHTANDVGLQLPGELTTVVERLARAGYRTAAVTDAAFFTPMHGLDQGFESFHLRPSSRWDLDWTVARALEHLTRDDGRPLFLLVHSYRTHMPYRVGPDEDRGPWDELRADGCQPLATRTSLPEAEWRARLAACAPRFRELYQQGVRDLDRGFGLFVEGLEEAGLLERGFVIFTSDHGEALGENHDIFHGQELWDSKLRIPLLVAGPGIAARDVDHGVTLLDLAPTLAGIADIERDPRWPGRSLFTVTEERPSWAFRLQKTSQLALVEGDHKLLAVAPEAFERGSCELGFDLARDPHEEHPVPEQPWAAELARRRAAELRALLVPATGSEEASLSEQQRTELRALGYTGDDEPDEEGEPPERKKP